MADPKPLDMAGFLQGRTLSYAPSEFTTANELLDERISQGLGWDTTHPGQEFLRRALTQLPLALRTSLRPPMPINPNAEFSLSQNMMARDPNRFTYDIYNRGNRIGNATGRVDGDTATIHQIGPADAVGVAGLRQLREGMRSDFPQVQRFTGARVSGARVPSPEHEPIAQKIFWP